MEINWWNKWQVTGDMKYEKQNRFCLVYLWNFVPANTDTS